MAEKKTDPGLATVVIALTLAGAWAVRGIFFGPGERRNVDGFAAFFLAFVLLLLVAWLIRRRRR